MGYRGRMGSEETGGLGRIAPWLLLGAAGAAIALGVRRGDKTGAMAALRGWAERVLARLREAGIPGLPQLGSSSTQVEPLETEPRIGAGFTRGVGQADPLAIERGPVVESEPRSGVQSPLT